MTNWQLLSLEVDDGGKDIGEYLSNDLGYDIKRISLEDFLAEEKKISNLRRRRQDPLDEARSWEPPNVRGKSQLISLMETFTADAPGPVLAVYGSGYFHHYTYGLTAAASRLSEEFCYIHFDAHIDCFPMRRVRIDGTVVYSDFVEDIVKDESHNAREVIMVGSFLGGFDWCKGIPYAPLRLLDKKLNSEEGLEDLAELLDATCHDVYISFDLDVTPADEILTDWRDWERGNLRKKQLMKMLSLIKEKKNIIGADILGFNCSTYGFKSREDFQAMRQKSRLLYKDIIDVIVS